MIRRGARLRRREMMLASAGMVACGVGSQAARAAEPLAVSEVAPGVFVHRGVHQLATPENLGGIANVGFVVGDEAVAVIDTGGCSRGGAGLLAAVQRVSALPIRYVVATHVHPDHLFGHAAFLAEEPTFVGHAKLPAALAMRGAPYLEQLRAEFGTVGEGTEVVGPTVTVDEPIDLDLGGRRLRLVAHPTAHTDNDLSVYDDATGTLWLADLLFMERVPVVDGSLLGWLEVLETTAGWPAERVVPGHGPVSAPWPDAATSEIRYLAQLRDEVRAVIERDGTIEEAVATVGASERSSWLLFDYYHGRNVTAAFTELEWE